MSETRRPAQSADRSFQKRGVLDGEPLWFRVVLEPSVRPELARSFFSTLSLCAGEQLVIRDADAESGEEVPVVVAAVRRSGSDVVYHVERVTSTVPRSASYARELERLRERADRAEEDLKRLKRASCSASCGPHNCEAWR